MSSDVNVDAPVDPEVDLHVRSRRRGVVRGHGVVLVVIALGGGAGALARYGLSQLLPSPPGHFPWATFVTNVLGCFLMGALMVLITDVWSAHRLLRPFLGVGVLGGFTTFSTYAVEVRGLLQPASVTTAFAYLIATPVCALLAVVGAVGLTRWATGVLRSRGEVA